MKTILTLIFASAIVCGFAQNPVIYQTTEEEYNYLTVGYAQDLASGHDLKQGYQLLSHGQP